jgi:Zn-finger nucleic acid-binding protein
MHCPIHGTLPTTEQDDFDTACPECRQAWSSRGTLYELPPRQGRFDPEDHQPAASE